MTKVKLQSARQQSAFLMEKYESVYTESGGEALASALSLLRTDTAVGAAYVRANPTSTGAVMNQLRLAGVFCALTDDQVNALKVRSCTGVSYMGSLGGGGGGPCHVAALSHIISISMQAKPKLAAHRSILAQPFPAGIPKELASTAVTAFASRTEAEQFQSNITPDVGFPEGEQAEGWVE